MKRSAYFDVACCPANLARLLEQVPGLVYAQTSDTIYANLYVGNHATINVGNRSVRVREETRYPWDGRVTLRVDPDRAGEFTIAVRIPGWARDEAVPGGLYRFTGRGGDARLEIRRGDGGESGAERVPLDVRNGYVRIKRTWRTGDAIDIFLAMTPRRVVARAEVDDDAGKTALQYGPLVYAFEAVDNGGKARDLEMPADARLVAEFHQELLGGVVAIAVTGARPLVAIPYYAWNNRGAGEMAVWLHDGRPAGAPSLLPQRH